MTLPADIARCKGKVEGAEVHPECQTCRRTEPLPQGIVRGVFMGVPEFNNGKCPLRIKQ